MSTHKPLLIIKTGNTIPTLRERGEDFEDWFRLGAGLDEAQCRTVSLFLGEPLPDLDTVPGIIITGSPAYVTDLEPWNYVGGQYLREAHARAIPTLGVCYGHQLLAWTFGGEVHHHPGGREIGTVEVTLNDAGLRDPLLGELPERFAAQVSHQQSVLRLPVGAVLLAGNKFDPHQAFRLGESTWGVQFHPEFSAEITRAYIEERRDVLASEGLDPDRLLAEVTDSPEAAALLKRFAAVTANY